MYVHLYLIIGILVVCLAILFGACLSRNEIIRNYETLFKLQIQFIGFQSKQSIKMVDVGLAVSCASRLEPHLRKIIRPDIKDYSVGRTVEILHSVFGRKFLGEVIEDRACSVAVSQHFEDLVEDLLFEDYKPIYEHLLGASIYYFLNQQSPIPFKKTA